VSALATAALVYVHRQRIKTGNGNGHTSTSVTTAVTSGGHRPAPSAERRPCKFHLPAALITLTSQSPKFSIKLRRTGNAAAGSSQGRHGRSGGGDFQLLSNSSTRCSFPPAATVASADDLSRTNTYCSLKRFGKAGDEGEAAFLEVRHRSGVNVIKLFGDVFY